MFLLTYSVRLVYVQTHVNLGKIPSLEVFTVSRNMTGTSENKTNCNVLDLSPIFKV